ncbi:MAG: MFS transporter [Armatimonadetes bacterium]|nr:MFS transporter [Armatimonadota bacterium]
MIERLRRLWQTNPQLVIFLVATAFFGLSSPNFDIVFNNYLNDTFHLGEVARGDLEFPRELPGFLVAVSAGLLFFLAETRIGAVAAVVTAAGMVGLSLVGDNYAAMMVLMIAWSAGTHLSMPVQGSIGLSLSRENQEGRRLGQLGSVSGAAYVIGCGIVWWLLRQYPRAYHLTFLVGGAGYAVAAIVLLLMDPSVGSRTRPKIALHPRYWLYYVLSVLFGARKQVFLTFGPWVLVKVYGQPASIFAVLLLVGGIAGIFLRPLLGRLIDRVGERAVLMGDAVILIVICLGYGFGDRLGLGRHGTIHLLYVCYVLDQVVFATGMARSTYLKKIAVDPQHVASSLALGVSLDHATSMSIPRAGGRLWHAYGRFGYRYVFLAAAGIAIVNLLFASLIRIPRKTTEGEAVLPPSPMSLDEPPTSA